MIPAAVSAPYARGAHVAERHVVSQHERDVAAIALARHKGVLLGQLGELGADDRLHPESLPVVEWFAAEVRAARSGERLSELTALLPGAGIRRRRFWQGKPAAITTGYDDDEPGEYDDGEYDDQADDPAALPGAPAAGRARRMTWAEAIAALGWRLVPAGNGCQLLADGRPCAGSADRDIGNAWVCGAHYGTLGTVIWRDHHGRTGS
ncbi:MAG TPA: hypothetical protein VGG25_29325 [Streptosporangiaceae bacterium]